MASVKHFIYESTESLDEAKRIGDTELRALAKEARGYANKLPKRDLGKEIRQVTTDQKVREEVAEFYAGYLKLIRELDMAEKQIDPLTDADVKGRKRLQAEIGSISETLKGYAKEVGKIEATIAKAKGKSEVSALRKQAKEDAPSFKDRVKGFMKPKK